MRDINLPQVGLKLAQLLTYIILYMHYIYTRSCFDEQLNFSFPPQLPRAKLCFQPQSS